MGQRQTDACQGVEKVWLAAAAMACSRMLVLLAVLSFAVSAHCQAQTTPNQQIVSTQSGVVNRLVPVTSRVVVRTPAELCLAPHVLPTERNHLPSKKKYYAHKGDALYLETHGAAEVQQDADFLR